MRRLLIPVALVAWVFLWHGRALTGGFWADDWFQIAPRTAGQIAKTFAGDWNRGDRGQGGFYRPLVRVSFGLDRAMYGDAPWGYHLTNLLLLSGMTLLVWGLGRRLLPGEWPALAAALIFPLHPTQAELAWWVSARADLLAGLGVLGALVVWCGGRIRGQDLDAGTWPAPRRRAAAWACALLGLTAKETALAGLALLPLLDALLLSAGMPPPEDPRRALRIRRWLLRAVLPAAILGAGYLVLRTSVLGGIGGYLAHESEPMGLDRVGLTYRQFLSGLLWPPGTRGEYGAGWIGWVVLFGGGLLAFGFPRHLTFCAAGALLAIAPMVGLTLGPLAGGRYMLLPGAFGVLAWAALISSFPIRRANSAFPWILPGALVLMGLLWTPALDVAAGRWKDADAPNRRAMRQIREWVETLGHDTPGRIAILSGPIPHGYHIWAPGDAVTVALWTHGLSRGWKTDFVDCEKPFPCPVALTRPDGKEIRAWIGIPPDLTTGSLVLRVMGDGTVHAAEVADVERRAWDARQLARWEFRGPGRVDMLNSGAAASLSAPVRLSMILDGGDFLLSEPEGESIAPTELRTVVAAMTGQWNRRGTAILRPAATGNPLNRKLVGEYARAYLAVPPAFSHTTAYGHIIECPWPARWELLPLNRPGRIALERLELTAYLLYPTPRKN